MTDELMKGLEWSTTFEVAALLGPVAKVTMAIGEGRGMGGTAHAHEYSGYKYTHLTFDSDTRCTHTQTHTHLIHSLNRSSC